jgi:hypothetical protein
VSLRRDAETAKEDERGSAEQYQALLTNESGVMKARVLRLAITLSGVVAVALAGGATIRPF